MSSNLILLILKFYSLLFFAFFFSNESYGLRETVDKPVNTTNYTVKEKNMKYILQWSSSYNDLFILMGIGRQGFIDRNCSHTNCYITSKKELQGNISKFDAILFYGPEIWNYTKDMLPQDRSVHQNYIFVSDKCSKLFPILSQHFDGFFNWTWTYRLNSDLIWRHIVVADQNKTIVGPNLNMHWIKKENMAPVHKYLRTALEGKTEAVFWMPFNCNIVTDHRVTKLYTVLKKYYELNIDIHGECSDLKCISGDTYDEDYDECSSIIMNNYYFYIVFEEAMSVDYVTTEILPALQNHAVPIVFGGVNYKRFLPDGSYLNAEELDTYTLASKIHELINDHNKYYEYFKWTNHYQYFSSKEYGNANQYCELCALLNDEKVNQTSEYKDFRSWWNLNGSKVQKQEFKSVKVRTEKPPPHLPVVYYKRYPTYTYSPTYTFKPRPHKATIAEKILHFTKNAITKIGEFLTSKY